MKILRHILKRDDFHVPSPIVTLGNFDGVHLGHQAVLQKVDEAARIANGRSVVVTFEPHPLQILAPQSAPRLLLTLKDKLKLLRAHGVGVAVVQRFDEGFASLTADAFVQDYLVRRLRARQVWVGRDLRFGKDRRGSVDDLIRWGDRAGFTVHLVDPVKVDGVRVSSSHIRALLEKGLVTETRRFLGRHYSISGRVVSGLGRGASLGFPTANILPRNEIVPLDGIYATLFRVDGRDWPSVTSVGVNPTFGAGPRTVESHLFDFSGDLYRRPIELFFVRRLREERQFKSAELLIEQMAEDARAARQTLGRLKEVL
jgi:riboflavin kinase/FMN adenylyltransferase